MDADSKILAAQLAEHGPMLGGAIRCALQWPLGRLGNVVRRHSAGWFVLTARGWDLTELGRTANEVAEQPMKKPGNEPGIPAYRAPATPEGRPAAERVVRVVPAHLNTVRSPDS